MLDIRHQTSIWSKIKYSAIDLNQPFLKNKYNALVLSSFREMGISDLFMVGDSVEDLPRNMQAEEWNGGPKFTEAFHKLSKEKYINPGLYLALVLKEFKDQDCNEKLLIGYLSRALRSFPSFLREPDLAYKLKSELEKDGSNVKLNMDPDQDLKGKVDIEITYKNNIFNIWSYQASKRGLPNTLERLKGFRGDVRNGINILCPVKTELVNSYKIAESSLHKNKERIEDWKDKKKKAPRQNQRRINECNEKIQHWTNEYSDKKNKLHKLKKQLSKEFEIEHGWLLHSDEYVGRVKNKINQYINNSNCTQYDQLLKKLLYVDDFIENINIFNKQ